MLRAIGSLKGACTAFQSMNYVLLCSMQEMPGSFQPCESEQRHWGIFVCRCTTCRCSAGLGSVVSGHEKSNAPICFQCGRLLVCNCCLSGYAVWKLHVSVIGKACVTNFLFTSTSTLLKSIFWGEGFGLSLPIRVSY